MFEIELFAAAPGAPAAGFNWVYVGKHAFNLTVLVAGLYFILRKPVASFMRSRKRGMAERFEESGRKLEEAKKLFEEWSARLDGLEAEAGALRSSIAEQAEAERQSILLRAGREKEAILKDAADGIDAAAERARESIVNEAASAAMRIAESRLRESGAAADIDGFETAAGEGKWLRSQN